MDRDDAWKDSRRGKKWVQYLLLLFNIVCVPRINCRETIISQRKMTHSRRHGQQETESDDRSVHRLHLLSNPHDHACTINPLVPLIMYPFFSWNALFPPLPFVISSHLSLSSKSSRLNPRTSVSHEKTDTKSNTSSRSWMNNHQSCHNINNNCKKLEKNTQFSDVQVGTLLNENVAKRKSSTTIYYKWKKKSLNTSISVVKAY